MAVGNTPGPGTRITSPTTRRRHHPGTGGHEKPQNTSQSHTVTPIYKDVDFAQNLVDDVLLNYLEESRDGILSVRSVPMEERL